MMTWKPDIAFSHSPSNEVKTPSPVKRTPETANADVARGKVAVGVSSWSWREELLNFVNSVDSVFTSTEYVFAV